MDEVTLHERRRSFSVSEVSDKLAIADWGERRQVSVLFADVVGFTGIVEREGDEVGYAIERLVFNKLSQAVRDHGGSVRNFAGDSIMAVYGIPQVHEDAAVRACRTAMAIHEDFIRSADETNRLFGEPLTVRIGITSGIVLIASVQSNDAEPSAIGDTVNLASRLQNLAPPGRTLMCDATRRLVEGVVEASFFGEPTVKGRKKPLKVWELTSVRVRSARFDASIQRGLSPFVGRASELRQLHEALAACSQGCLVADISAEPGLGKTRLVHEFRLYETDATKIAFFTGYCTADGRHVPFLPILDVVREAFNIVYDDDLGEIAGKLKFGLDVLGLGTSENLALLLNFLGLAPQDDALAGLDGVLVGLRTRDLLLALITAKCASSKVVLVIEDIHWIDVASEQLLNELIEDGAHRNLMVVHTARPEYVPRWRGKPDVTTFMLAPLGTREIRSIVQTRLGIDSALDKLILQVTDRASGNPLFGEEIIGLMIDQGVLRVDDGAVQIDVARVGDRMLPGSLQTLLTARIERLPTEDRTLLQAAAVIGRRFDPQLLSLVVARSDQVGSALQRLEAQGILHRIVTTGDYEFKHILLRDSVYESLPSKPRAILHNRIAGAIELRSKDRLLEVSDTLAYHYGFTDRDDLVFTYLAMAGARSLGVFSLQEADRYFALALAVYQRAPASADDEAVAACLVNYALCLNLSLQVKKMSDLVENFAEVLNRIGDHQHHAIFLHHRVSSMIWNGRYAEALQVHHKLSAMAQRLGDYKSLAYSHVSALSVSSYAAPVSRDAFEIMRRDAEATLLNFEDAYLRYYFLANVGWNEVCRGNIAGARLAAERLTEIGRATNEPRALGYGTAMKALIAMIVDEHEIALSEAELAIEVSRVPFEMAIATSTKYTALALLNRPGALDQVNRYVTECAENGWLLFQQSPETMIASCLAAAGRIDAALDHLEAAILRREREGMQSTADWYCLFVCEIYLAILSGEGGGSIGVVVRNIRSILFVMLFGRRRIHALVERVRANPLFDQDGYFFARTEMILGLLYKVNKKKSLAVKHLAEAQRILAVFGPSPTLTRIEIALRALM